MEPAIVAVGQLARKPKASKALCTPAVAVAIDGVLATANGTLAARCDSVLLQVPAYEAIGGRAGQENPGHEGRGARGHVRVLQAVDVHDAPQGGGRDGDVRLDVHGEAGREELRLALRLDRHRQHWAAGRRAQKGTMRSRADVTVEPPEAFHTTISRVGVVAEYRHAPW